jgi:CO dehydrogenase nickel-insertion accessory protein CooC1
MLTELVDISSFRWDMLPDCGFFEILGKRGTGKTTWTQYILQHSRFRDTGLFIVVAGSEIAKRSWANIVHPIFIVDPAISYLEELMKTQNNMVRMYEQSTDPFPENKHVTLIFDDVSSNKKLMRSQVMSYLASNSRHMQMSIFILAQYHCQIVAEVRNQFDNIMVLSTADTKSITRLHAEYCSCIENRMFKIVMSTTTKDYGMLVIDNQARNMELNTVCFYSRLTNYPPTLNRLGHVDTWSFGDVHYLDQYKERPTEAHANDWEKSNSNNVVVTEDRRGKVIMRLI